MSKAVPRTMSLLGEFHYSKSPPGKDGYVIKEGFKPIGWIDRDAGMSTVMFMSVHDIRPGERVSIEILVLCPDCIGGSFEKGDIVRIGSFDFEIGEFRIWENLGYG